MSARIIDVSGQRYTVLRETWQRTKAGLDAEMLVRRGQLLSSIRYTETRREDGSTFSRLVIGRHDR